MRNRRKFLKTSLLNLNKALVAWVIKYYLFIILVLYILSITFVAISKMGNNLKVVLVIIPGAVLIFCLALYLEYRKVVLKEDLEFPTFKKRFTHKIGANVYVKPEEWQDAIVYLNYVEDFLENAGVYNSKGE